MTTNIDDIPSGYDNTSTYVTGVYGQLNASLGFHVSRPKPIIYDFQTWISQKKHSFNDV